MKYFAYDFILLKMAVWCHDTQHNNIQYNDIKFNVIMLDAAPYILSVTIKLVYS